MHRTTVGIDLAKNRFEVAVADEHYRITQRRTLKSRSQFQRFIANHPPALWVMEACGSAHYWGRKLGELGHQVRLLPAQYVRAYVKRNKTDRADAAALVEASRSPEIRPVPIKTAEQQQIQQLHRLREQLKADRTARINLLRGMLREHGISIPRGVHRGLSAIRQALESADNGLPEALRPWIAETLEEIASLRERTTRIERQLKSLTQHDPQVQRWMELTGVGLLGASAARASVGELSRFRSARHFASYLGLTPAEHSSGERRRLGRISKRGNVYLRTLLVHGARSALFAAMRAERAGRRLDHLSRWALELQRRRGTNKATVALANKIARIIWATATYQRRFNGNWSARHGQRSSSAA